MACERCNQDERVPVKRAKLAERDGKVAVVLDVPMEECPSCGDRWARLGHRQASGRTPPHHARR